MGRTGGGVGAGESGGPRDITYWIYCRQGVFIGYFDTSYLLAQAYGNAGGKTIRLDLLRTIRVKRTTYTGDIRL